MIGQLVADIPPPSHGQGLHEDPDACWMLCIVTARTPPSANLMGERQTKVVMLTARLYLICVTRAAIGLGAGVSQGQKLVVAKHRARKCSGLRLETGFEMMAVVRVRVRLSLCRRAGRVDGHRLKAEAQPAEALADRPAPVTGRHAGLGASRRKRHGMPASPQESSRSKVVQLIQQMQRRKCVSDIVLGCSVHCIVLLEAGHRRTHEQRNLRSKAISMPDIPVQQQRAVCSCDRGYSGAIRAASRRSCSPGQYLDHHLAGSRRIQPHVRPLQPAVLEPAQVHKGPFACVIRHPLLTAGSQANRRILRSLTSGGSSDIALRIACWATRACVPGRQRVGNVSKRPRCSSTGGRNTHLTQRLPSWRMRSMRRPAGAHRGLGCSSPSQSPMSSLREHGAHME